MYHWSGIIFIIVGIILLLVGAGGARKHPTPNWAWTLAAIGIALIIIGIVLWIYCVFAYGHGGVRMDVMTMS